jgi:nucleoside-diphosphate-sugar epimerase
VKLLVTGAGGFLGSAVVRAALNRGLDVVAVARRPQPGRLPDAHRGYSFRIADMIDPAGIRALVEAERPDAIVHSAWSGVTSKARESTAQLYDNLLPSCALIEAAATSGVRTFVGIGSQAEYGRIDGIVSEDRLPSPTSLYGAVKLATCEVGGAISLAAGMRFAWLRLFATYGPGDNPAWLIPSLIQTFRSGARPKLTSGTQKWDYLFIDDAAAGVLAAVCADGAAGIFNLASGTAVPVRQIVETIRDITVPDMELVYGEVPFGKNQIMHMEGSYERLRAATGWAPTTELAEGLSRTVAASS